MASKKLSTQEDVVISLTESETKSGRSSKKGKAANYTLLKAIEEIVIELHRSGLEESALNECRDAVEYITDRCQLTPWQAVMFALCIDQSTDPEITIADLRRWVDCPMICMIRHQIELDELVEIGALMEGEPGKTVTYAVPRYVMDGLNKDQFVTSAASKDLSFAEFFNRIGEIFSRRRNGMSYNQAKKWLERLVKDNMNLTYCQHMLSYKGLKEDEVVLLHYICHRAVNHDDLYINEEDFFGILDNRCEIAINFRNLRLGQHALMKMELVECMTGDGMGMPSTFTLTSNARRTLLIEANLEDEPTQIIRGKELVTADTIMPKEMFYTDNVAKDISRLTSLVAPEQFKEICDRLTEHGMRRGFACLFYGAPGTGKTETALQLARITGRDIMQVNISDMRSKWVGESEKMIKNLFDRYRRAVSQSAVAPILLFNEADALLTRRKDVSESSVDKMENAMQNIILQEMENLEGILIATTNLTTNLDDAFERRFLYKVKFEKPDVACRGKLWMSLVKGLDASVAERLATRYDFSGGQIENVARKLIVDTILYGEPEHPYDSLAAYCESELIAGRNATPVGFAK